MVAFTVPECEKLDKDDAAFVVDLGFPIKGKAAGCGHAIPFRPELCGNYGIPVKVSWAGSEGPLTDGFGLCSPSRWTPSARGARLGETARRFAPAMHTLVKSFVLRVTPDPERTAMELVLGRYTSSPFSEKDMAQLRKQWVSLLGDSQVLTCLRFRRDSLSSCQPWRAPPSCLRTRTGKSSRKATTTFAQGFP